MTKLLPLCASVLLTACAASSPTPASSPASSAGTELQPTGATEAQGATGVRHDLKVELAVVDAALADLGRRLEVARDAAKADVKQQLTALQAREDDLRAQLRQSESLADAEAEKARLGIQRAITDLNMDVTQLAYRLSH